MINSLIEYFNGSKNRLTKPIFLVGCSKSGTTMLGLIIGFHAEVGPPIPHRDRFNSLQIYLKAILDAKVFGPIANEIERKKVWDKYFPANHVPLRTGKELILLENPLTKRKTRKLIQDLSKDLKVPRFFSKGPFNTFRIHVLREIFPDAKIINIYRDGRDVISSWGRMRGWEEFGGYEQSISIFARKWNESVAHIEAYKKEMSVLTIKYEDIVSNPEDYLPKVFDFCELNHKALDFKQLELRNATGIWKTRIPEQYHNLVMELTTKNRQKLGYSDE